MKDCYELKYDKVEKTEYCKTDDKIIVRRVVETYFDLADEKAAKQYEKELKAQIERNKKVHQKGHTK